MCGITLTIRLKPPSLPASGPGRSDTTTSTSPNLHTLFESLRNANAARGPDAQSTVVHHLRLDGGHEVEVCLSASVLGLRGNGVTAQPMSGDRGVLVWNGQVFDGLNIRQDDNDTKRIFERLESGEDVSAVLSRIEGPYAFVYLDIKEEKVYYQADPLSRRSLLIHPAIPPTSEDAGGTLGTFILSSTRSGEAREAGVGMRALLGGEGGVIDLRKLEVKSLAGQPALDFSIAHTSQSHLSPTYGHESLTRLSSINSILPPDGPLPPIPDDHVEVFLKQLGQSVKRRVENIPSPSSPKNARAAVLFSGGVDSVLLAYKVHLWIPHNEPIELINVAFQQRRPPSSSIILDGKDQGDGSEYDVPDRLGGREALVELQSVAQGREFRFVEIDVPQTEYLSRRQEIVDLMYPCTTEMDLSLASPFFFASRGIGHLRSPTSDKTPYVVKAKVYFSGLGPDERQLAGYARHRGAFLHRGWPGLLKEVQLDVSRLSTRNTSRDDRLLSHHARDARFPYLDLSFIEYLGALPLWEKCDPTEPGGDKLLLRRAAARVGLQEAAKRVKRAMQFGSRSAKIGELDSPGSRAGAGEEGGGGKRRGKGAGARSVV